MVICSLICWNQKLFGKFEIFKWINSFLGTENYAQISTYKDESANINDILKNEFVYSN